MTAEELSEMRWLGMQQRAAEVEVTRLKLELAKWQDGGMAEELLRANDGHLRIGKGVSLVRSEDIDAAFAAKRTLMGMGFKFQDGNWINANL